MSAVVLDKPSVDECEAFCCHQSGCVAFTLSTAPAPAFACQQGDVCCYLKGSLGDYVADSKCHIRHS